MALDSKSGIRSSGVSPVASNCPTPDVSPLANQSSSFESLENISLRHGTFIANRVFVGGFDQRVSERDLWHIFCQFGPLKGVNIVQNRSRLTKGYGFVTFENSDDARRLLLDIKGIYFKDKKLSVRPAVRRPYNSGNSNGHMFTLEPPPQFPCGTVYHTTSGFPYTFHNGVAYFHSPQGSHAPHVWTHPPAAVMVPQPCQPVYQQPAYHHHHYQQRYFPNHFQWHNVDAAVGSGPVIHSPPEYMHHIPEGIPLHQPPLAPLPLLDDTNTEYYDPGMHHGYPVYHLRERVHPHQYGKNHVYQSFQVPSAPASSYSRDQPSAAEELKPEPQRPRSAQ